MRSKKLIIEYCEVCGERDKTCLEVHHIIPRTDILTSNKPHNLGILCASCHSKHHRGSLEIEGIYPATKPPNNRILVYKLNGKKNIELEEPYLEEKLEGMKVYGL